MKKLTENDKERLFEYIAAEPEMNLFFFGDVEKLGIDSDVCEVFALENEGGWDAVILRYMKFYNVYSRYGSYDADAVAEFLKSREEIKSISGKAQVISSLERFFPSFRFEKTYMSRCNEAVEFEHRAKGVVRRRVLPDDAMAVVELFCRIDEFKDNYLGREEECAEEERVTIGRGATCYGYFHGNELVSYAQMSAENSQSAMLIGVATLPEWRGLGLASANVSALCREEFDEGRKFVCLFYNNPDAGRIYNKIGFHEIGEYTLSRPRKEETS